MNDEIGKWEKVTLEEKDEFHKYVDVWMNDKWGFRVFFWTFLSSLWFDEFE